MKSILSISAVIMTIGVLGIPLVWSDSDFRFRDLEEYEHQSTGVANVNNPLYQQECGSCHMAYPPGLLPEVSWQKVMTTLDDHFGENAELDDETNKQITQYLSAYSADNSGYRRSKKFAQMENTENINTRITQTGYFRHEHNEIPPGMVTANPKVKSFSQCNACHTRADKGLFNEHDILIPGYGRWDD